MPDKKINKTRTLKIAIEFNQIIPDDDDEPNKYYFTFYDYNTGERKVLTSKDSKAFYYAQQDILGLLEQSLSNFID